MHDCAAAELPNGERAVPLPILVRRQKLRRMHNAWSSFGVVLCRLEFGTVVGPLSCALPPAHTRSHNSGMIARFTVLCLVHFCDLLNVVPARLGANLCAYGLPNDRAHLRMHTLMHASNQARTSHMQATQCTHVQRCQLRFQHPSHPPWYCNPTGCTAARTHACTNGSMCTHARIRTHKRASERASRGVRGHMHIGQAHSWTPTETPTVRPTSVPKRAHAYTRNDPRMRTRDALRCTYAPWPRTKMHVCRCQLCSLQHRWSLEPPRHHSSVVPAGGCTHKYTQACTHARKELLVVYGAGKL